MKPLAAPAIKGTWGTLLLPIQDNEAIDLGRLRAEIAALARAGLQGVYSNGTAGEFYSQTEDEFDEISATLAAECERMGLPFQIGVSHMSAQISLERLRRAVSLRPVAVQVILPDWMAVTLEEAVSFLLRMGEAASPIGLVVYNPPGAKRVLEPEEWHWVLERVPPVVGIKVAGGDAAWYARMQPVISRASVFVAGHTLATGVAHGAAGSYSNVACLSPRGAARWYETMHADPERASATEQRLQAFFRTHIIPFITEQKYTNSAVDKLLAAIGGWAGIGTRLRWPYRSIPEAEAMRLREIARRELPEWVTP